MGKSAPKAPDPVALANAQSDANIKTATAQQKLAMMGQSNPFGDMNYVADPNSPSGFRAVSNVSSQFQPALTNVSNALATPFDINAGRATELADINRTLMDPLWDQRQQSHRTDLLNRGMREGSEGWATADRNFNQSRDDAYNRMHLAAYTTANNAALQERERPFTEMGALFGMQPNKTTPAPGVAPTDIVTPTMQNYQTQMQSYNAGMGGMFGLGATALGGWAMNGYPSPTKMFSDPRLKTSISRIGEDARGWGLYMFRYIWDAATDAWRYGVMADEVAPIRPDAVVLHPSGFAMVDYAALA